MSIDRTLKIRGSLKGTRSVLTRAERITRMLDEEKFEANKTSPLGLAKTRVKATKAGGKKKASKEESKEESK